MEFERKFLLSNIKRMYIERGWHICICRGEKNISLAFIYIYIHGLYAIAKMKKENEISLLYIFLILL